MDMWDRQLDRVPHKWFEVKESQRAKVFGLMNHSIVRIMNKTFSLRFICLVFQKKSIMLAKSTIFHSVSCDK